MATPAASLELWAQLRHLGAAATATTMVMIWGDRVWVPMIHIFRVCIYNVAIAATAKANVIWVGMVFQCVRTRIISGVRMALNAVWVRVMFQCAQTRIIVGVWVTHWRMTPKQTCGTALLLEMPTDVGCSSYPSQVDHSTKTTTMIVIALRP